MSSQRGITFTYSSGILVSLPVTAWGGWMTLLFLDGCYFHTHDAFHTRLSIYLLNFNQASFKSLEPMSISGLRTTLIKWTTWLLKNALLQTTNHVAKSNLTSIKSTLLIPLYHCRKSLSFSNFKWQFFASSPPFVFFCIHAQRALFHKLANHVKEL